jgi:hypothetical protein
MEGVSRGVVEIEGIKSQKGRRRMKEGIEFLFDLPSL